METVKIEIPAATYRHLQELVEMHRQAIAAMGYESTMTESGMLDHLISMERIEYLKGGKA